uniref:Uncharacterized protein n=1 Tax=Rhizophora mucronata TaxID=61149 RepID=A0A2P2PF64_RHIMU
MLQCNVGAYRIKD